MDARDRRGSPVPAADIATTGADEPATVQMHVGDLPSEQPALPEPTRRRVGWVRIGVACVAVVAVAVAATLVVSGDDETRARLPDAPTSPVAPRWSVVVEGAEAIVPGAPGRATVEPTVEVVDGVVLHTLRSRVGQVTAVVQRSTATGTVGWRREVDVGVQPVVVTSSGVVSGPSGRWLTARTGGRELVGLAVADGQDLWQEPVGADFAGWVDPSGSLFVSGNGRCGFLDPTTGLPRFITDARTCVPAGRGLAHDTPDGWAVLDDHGQRLAVVDHAGVAPRVVGGRVVSSRAEDVHVVTREGDDRAVPAPRLDRLADAAVDDDHLAAWAGVDQFVVDLDEPRLLGPFAPAAVPVVVDGDLLVVDDGSFPAPELVSSGTWSRSPDANEVRVVDADGHVLASRRMVLAPPMLATAGGVLLWEQVGTDSTLGLYGYEDLEPVWEVAFRGTPLAGLASSGDLVAASYLDRRGRVRLVGLGPA